VWCAVAPAPAPAHSMVLVGVYVCMYSEGRKAGSCVGTRLDHCVSTRLFAAPLLPIFRMPKRWVEGSQLGAASTGFPAWDDARRAGKQGTWYRTPAGPQVSFCGNNTTACGLLLIGAGKYHYVCVVGTAPLQRHPTVPRPDCRIRVGI
jgi:hypothetical protein